MRIAFDAKRAYQNTTGLGNYSRMLIDRLAIDYPQHVYFAMAPKQTELYQPTSPQIHTITPTGLNKTLSSMWRSNWVKKDLQKLNIDIYHGLSHEIPVGMQHTGIKSVVTIHDLIFERYPKQFKAADVLIYRRKFSYACKHADKVLAVSKQTKDDIIHYYRTDAGKIEVCPIATDPMFENHLSNADKANIRKRHNLPEQYFLYVGSVIERKNLLNACKALDLLKGKLDVPLVVIGSMKSEYAAQIAAYVKETGSNVLFFPFFKNSEDLPAIYQSATALIFPSIYEGFGLPVLEGLWSGVPVITSNVSCLPEVGGDAAYYIDPRNADDIADAMLKVATDDALRVEMIQKGLVQAKKFTPSACAERVMNVYNSLL